MFKSGSTRLVKGMNQQHVLNLVRMHRGITAPEISRATGLQMSTISYTLRELKERGLIREIGLGESTFQGGKRPVLWDLAPSYGVVVGVELIPQEIRLVLLDFSMEVLFQRIYPCDLRRQPERIAGTVEEVVREALATQGLRAEEVLGLGIGIPGLIDSRRGVIRYSYAFDIRDFDFKEKLTPLFSFPIEIGNDANVGALGIKWLSRTEHLVPHILYVTINQNFRGMGTGLIMNHELYLGAHGCAGEITSFFLPTQRQRLIAHVAEKFGKDAPVMKRLASQEPGNIPVADVVEAATEGDEAAKYLLREIAKVIARELARLVDMFDPHLVVIGGDVCEAEQFIARMIRERVASMVISDCLRTTPIQFSPFGIYSVAMGSAALIFQKIFLEVGERRVKTRTQP